MLEPKQIARFVLILVLLYLVLMGARSWVERPYAAYFRFAGNAAFSRFWFWRAGSVTFLDLHAPNLPEQIENEFRRRVERHLRQQFEQGLPQPAGLDPDSRARFESMLRQQVDTAAAQARQQLSKLGPAGVLDTLMVLWNRSTPLSFGRLRTSSRMMGYSPTVFLIALFVAVPTTWRGRAWALLWGLLLIHVFIFLRLSLTLAKDGFAAPKSYALFGLSDFWTGALARVEEVVVDNPTCYLFVCVFIWLLVCFLTGSFSAFRQGPSAEAEAGAR